MRIVYVVPGPMSKTTLGHQEVERRGKKLQQWSSPGTDTTIWDVDSGPASIESAYEEYLAIPATAALIIRAEQQDWDAAILGCLGDPGLDAMREVTTKMPVVGPGEASCHLATMLGERFGIITVAQGVVNPLRHLVARAGLSERLAGISVIDTPVLDLASDIDTTIRRAVHAGRELITKHGADTLVLGCMTMAFLDLTGQIEEHLNVPVVNPAKAALHVAETLVACDLRHSKLAYPQPAKLAATPGLDLASLSLGN